MKPFVSACLLTLAFAVLYGALRQLPNETCGLFHYEVSEITAEGLEFCKGDAGSFIDLVRLPFPVRVNATHEGLLIPGEPATITLSLSGPGGNLFLPHHLTKSHTELLHLFIVDASLEDYQHIHPDPLGISGEWAFSFTPKKPGSYTLYAQFVHAKTRRTLLAHTNLPGSEPIPSLNKLSATSSLNPKATLFIKQGSLNPGTPAELIFTIIPQTPPLSIEPLMGAYAHAVVFSQNHTGLAHLHPLPSSLVKEDKAELRFLFQPNFAGSHRLWLQFKQQGQEIFLPFDLTVTED